MGAPSVRGLGIHARRLFPLQTRLTSTADALIWIIEQHFSLWYFLGVLIVLFTVQTFLGSPPVRVLAYSEFTSLLQAGKIKDVTITEDQLTGTAEMSGAADGAGQKNAQPAPAAAGPGDYKFVVARVPDANLVAELRAAKVKFAGRIENRWFGTLALLEYETVDRSALLAWLDQASVPALQAVS